MPGLNSLGHGLKAGLLAAAIGLCAAPLTALAQGAPAGGPGSLNGVWSNPAFTTVRVGRPGGDDQAPADAAPRVAKDADGKVIEVLPWAAKIAAARATGVVDGKPYLSNNARCVSVGMPGAMSTNAQAPVQYIETPDQKQVTVLNEDLSTFRVIRLDQPHAVKPKPSLMGDAVGHWEGDTLVVDTIAVSTESSVRDFPHTDKLHIVERIRRTGPATLEDRAVIEDPGAFAKPFTQLTRFKMVSGLRLGEFVCTNNRPSDPGAAGAHPGF